MLARWAEHVALDATTARAFRTRSEFWKRHSALLEGRVLSIAPGGLVAGDVEKTLADAIVADAGAVLFRATESDRSETLRVQTARGCGAAGVPVAYAGGPFRVSAEVRWTDAPWPSEVRFGLLSRSAGAERSEFDLRVRGNNGINHLHLEIPNSVDADALLGHWLRLELETIEGFAGYRMSVVDLDANRVVYHRLEATGKDPLAPGAYLLGFRPGEDDEVPFDLEVRRLSLAGRFQLLATPGEVPEASAAATAVARARLAGDPVALAAALRRLADLSKEDPRAPLWRIEAKFLESGTGDGAASLVAESSELDRLPAWLSTAPRDHRNADRWLAAGRTALALAGKDLPDPDRQPVGPVDALRASALVEGVRPGTLQRAILLLHVAAETIRQQPTDPPRRDQALALDRRAAQLLASAPPVVREPFRPLRILLLTDAMRRTEALELAAPGLPELVAGRLELHSGMAARAKTDLEASAEEARRSGVGPSDE